MINRTYTLPEEIANTATHSIGALICSFLFGILMYSIHSLGHPDVSKYIGMIIFGLSSILMLVISSLYHAITNITLKRTMKICDHIAIYFLIVGTYIPLTLSSVVSTNPILGYSFILLQVLCLFGGVLFKLFSDNKYSIVSVLLYCCIGWSAIFIIGPLITNLPTVALVWLIAGGLAYTFGVPFYVLKQYKWTHSIWHLFVVLGVICHYLVMMNI